MTLYTINPNVKTIADFKETDRIAVPTVRLSFNAMMLQMAADELWNDPHRLDHLTVALGHPDAVTALSAGYGKASITAHIAVQPFTDRGLKLPGAHIITDSRKVFGGPLTQITLLGDEADQGQEPDAVQGRRQRARANRSRSPMLTSAPPRCCGRRRRRRPTTSTTWWPSSTIRASSSPRSRTGSLSSRHFLNRTGTMKAKLGSWKELFWETAHQQQGD